MHEERTPAPPAGKGAAGGGAIAAATGRSPGAAAPAVDSACDSAAGGANYAAFLHRDSKTPAPGAAFAPGILPTSVYALPGDPAGPYQYARWSNPGWTALEAALGALEDAEAVIFPSGMAAITAVLATVLRPGDRLLLQSDGYGGTRAAAEKFYAPLGVAIDTCATAQLAGQPLEQYRLVLVETPANPSLDLVDIRAAAQRVHAGGGCLVIDNTLMTPLGQRPLDLGADAVVYSDTKVLNGHSDVVFGHVSTRDADLLGRIEEWRRIGGAIPGPFETWMVQRGLETLELRVARLQANALALAQALAAHAAPLAVVYPGLASHPAHALARAQMSGFGGLIGLTLADKEEAEAFITECRYLRAQTSFGGVHSSAERRARWGDPVAAGFIRLAVGCEPTAALCTELIRALDVVRAGRG
jgi:cystathionine gamma-lyase